MITEKLRFRRLQPETVQLKRKLHSEPKPYSGQTSTITSVRAHSAESLTERTEPKPYSGQTSTITSVRAPSAQDLTERTEPKPYAGHTSTIISLRTPSPEDLTERTSHQHQEPMASTSTDSRYITEFYQAPESKPGPSSSTSITSKSTHAANKEAVIQHEKGSIADRDEGAEVFGTLLATHLKKIKGAARRKAEKELFDCLDNVRSQCGESINDNKNKNDPNVRVIKQEPVEIIDLDSTYYEDELCESEESLEPEKPNTPQMQQASPNENTERGQSVQEPQNEQLVINRSPEQLIDEDEIQQSYLQEQINEEESQHIYSRQQHFEMQDLLHNFSEQQFDEQVQGHSLSNEQYEKSLHSQSLSSQQLNEQALPEAFDPQQFESRTMSHTLSTQQFNNPVPSQSWPTQHFDRRASLQALPNQQFKKDVTGHPFLTQPPYSLSTHQLNQQIPSQSLPTQLISEAIASQSLPYRQFNQRAPPYQYSTQQFNNQGQEPTGGQFNEHVPLQQFMAQQYRGQAAHLQFMAQNFNEQTMPRPFPPPQFNQGAPPYQSWIHFLYQAYFLNDSPPTIITDINLSILQIQPLMRGSSMPQWHRLHEQPPIPILKPEGPFIKASKRCILTLGFIPIRDKNGGLYHTNGQIIIPGNFDASEYEYFF